MKRLYSIMLLLLTPKVLFAAEDVMAKYMKRDLAEGMQIIPMVLLWLFMLGLTIFVTIYITIKVHDLFHKGFVKITGSTEKQWNVADGIFAVIFGIITGGYGLGGSKKSHKK